MRTHGNAQLRAAVVGAIGVVALVSWLAVVPWVSLAANDGGWSAWAALLPCLTVTVLLCARLPGAAVTRVITAFTLCMAVSLINEAVGLLPYLRSGESAPVHVEGPLGSLAGALWAGTLPLLAVLLVVFPDGVPASRWWRAVLICQLAAIGLAVPVLVDQGDGQVSALSSAAGAIVGVVLLVSGLARAVALTWHWWHTEGERRRQLTPFVGAAAGLAAFYASSLIYVRVTGAAELGGPVVSAVVVAVVLAALPCAIGVSVLRHRLFGVEIVVNRVAVATLLSVLLFGVYAAAAALVAAATGGGGIQWPALVAAGVTVAALGPMYRVARAIIDRVMFGDRDRPDRVLRALAGGLGDAVNPVELPQVIVRTIADTLRLPFVSLDVASNSASVPTRLAVIGDEPGSERVSRFDISFGGDRLAELSVGARTGQSALTIPERGLLADLASQAGPALYATRLFDQLAESRERLRRGRIEERAMLSRALHDSVSPTLSGIAIAAAAGQLKQPGDPAIAALLGRIEQEAGSGGRTLKALLAGLRPPGLDEVGLVPAIEHRAAEIEAVASLHFEVDAREPLPALGTEVEEAAYLIAVEAMANAARHAGASRCHIVISGSDTLLHVAITDDGCGPRPAHRDGQGLRSARERALACGGTLVFGAQGGGGTRLLVTLPAWSKP